MFTMKRVDSSESQQISETEETTHDREPPRLGRHHSVDEGIPHQNGTVSHGSVHVTFDVVNDDEEESHQRRPRHRRQSTLGILDLNEDWITRNHFLERLGGESLPNDVIHAKLAEFVDEKDKEKETCRRKLAKHLTTTAFTIFILIIALLDATVTITAVILQIHSTHDEIIVRRAQHSKFNKFTRHAYGSMVNLKNVNTDEMLDRVGKYINGTYNATEYDKKSIVKRDIFSYEQRYSEISTKDQGYDDTISGGRLIQRQTQHKRRTETAEEKERGDRVLIRHKRAGGASADGSPLFESPTALQLATIAHYLHYASVALLSILLIEVMAKIFALGCEFFKSKVEVIDMIIISIAFFLDVYFIDSVMDNVAAAILLFIWQMIRVCTTLILQDRKRIDFLLDVVRESNEANKQKVDRYEEKNNSLETAVQRLTTLAKYNGATDVEIKRCTEIVVMVDTDEEIKKTQKKPVYKSIQTVFSNVRKCRGRKGGFILEPLHSVDDKPQSNQQPRRKRLSTDLSVELVHRQRKASHANVHSHGHQQSLNDIMHSLRLSRRRESVNGLDSSNRSAPYSKKRIHFLDGDLGHKSVPDNLQTPNFTFVSSFSPATSPSVSRTSSILKNPDSPRYIRKGRDLQSSPLVSRSSPLSRGRKEVGFVNDGFIEGEADNADVDALDNGVVVSGDGGCDSGANLKKVRRTGVHVEFSPDTTDGNDLTFNSGTLNDLRDSEGTAITTNNENFLPSDINTDPLPDDGYNSPYLSSKKLCGILKRNSPQPPRKEDTAHLPSKEAEINDDDEVTGF